MFLNLPKYLGLVGRNRPFHGASEVAKLLLRYYDKLYDTHVHSSSGTGGGLGQRECAIREVCQTSQNIFPIPVGEAQQ